jgi:SH3-like domain-containing protein
VAKSWSTDALLVAGSVAWWALLALLIARRFAAPGLRRTMARAALITGAALVVIAGSAAHRLTTVDLRRTAVVVAPGETPVRFEPSATGTVHFQVKPGATLELLGERDGWTQVGRSDGRRGWLVADSVAAL